MINNIIGFPKYHITEHGVIYRIESPEPKEMQQFDGNHGYRIISLSGHKRKTFLIHRLVALAYVPNHNGYLEVNHIDGDKLNNNYKNLEWCTRSHNIKHAFKMGLNKGMIGTENPKHKLSLYDVNDIRLLLTTTNMTQKMIADKFNVNQTLISAIKRNKIWVG